MISAVSLLQPLNGNNMKKYIYTLLLVFISALSIAQEKTEELEVHKINGKEYYIHTVEAGNTLYAISRKYAIPIEELKAANPTLSSELTIGDRLLIPLKEIVRKDVTEGLEIDGNFLVHEVQKRNTLYSLAKEYNVEINEIIAVNPEVEDGLKKGMKVKIPVNKIKSDESNTEYVVPAVTNPYVTHLVQAKETLYSLSKKYEVSIDSIKGVNNGLPEGLKVNQLINLPILKTYEDTSSVELSFDSTAVKQSYEVALLLPLYLDMLEETHDTTYKGSSDLYKKLFSKAQYGIEFYQGFKLAADSITKSGLNLNLKLIDTANDSAKVVEILSSKELDSVDLMVGPLYLNEFLLAADYAKANQINIVSPVKQSNKILLGNNYVSKVATSEPVRLKYLGQFMADSLKYENLFMVYPDHVKERKRVQLLQKYYNETVDKSNDSIRISFPKEIIWDASSFYEVKSKLQKNRRNTIVAPSDDEAFVTQFLSMLGGETEDYDIRVIGMDSWTRFESVEVEYLQTLKVHLVVSEFVDHNNPDVIAFEKKFADTYNLIPEKFSYLGYDVGMYYLKLLHEYGANFEVMFLGYQDQLLSRNFEFFKTGIESGYENHSVFLIHYKDYKLQKIE